jgi:hypothetical protein
MEKESNSNSAVEESSSAKQDAQKELEERVKNFASAHNSYSANVGSFEDRLVDSYAILDLVDEAIAVKQEALRSSGKFTISGQSDRLNGFQKTKLRNEVRNLITTRKQIKKEISQIEKALTGSFRKDNNRIVKASVRNSAKKSSYHKRYNGAIKKAITKTVNAFSNDKVVALKSEVAKSDPIKGDAIMMQALLKAPRHLQTKVIANPDARKLYLQHFRNELKVGKK